jgi:DNA mismatch endonuclease (patch repair protein)
VYGRHGGRRRKNGATDCQMDTLTPDQRRRNMLSVKAAGTKPERLLRAARHGLGLRFRLNAENLVGKPDLVFPKYRTAVFVHGCFWHGHQCHLFRWPKTRRVFWRRKIETNRCRDETVIAALIKQGWRVLVVWECVLQGRKRQPLTAVAVKCKAFIAGDAQRYRQLASSCSGN